MKLPDQRLNYIRQLVIDGVLGSLEESLLNHIDALTAEYTEELNRLSAERDIDSGLIIDLGKRLKDAEVKCGMLEKGLADANQRLEERQNVNS